MTVDVQPERALQTQDGCSDRKVEYDDFGSDFHAFMEQTLAARMRINPRTRVSGIALDWSVKRSSFVGHLVTTKYVRFLWPDQPLTWQWRRLHISITSSHMQK